ncbi:MAG: hypothetical protein ACPL7D_10265 [Candidatus Sumerlaeaceae bacterium]
MRRIGTSTARGKCKGPCCWRQNGVDGDLKHLASLLVAGTQLEPLSASRAATGVALSVKLFGVVWLCVFVAIVASFGFALRRAWRLQKEKARAAAANPGEPWKRRPDWAVGRIEFTGAKAAAIGFLVFALIWSAFISLFIYAFLSATPREGLPWPIYVAMFVFPVVGVGMAARAVVLLLRWRRYGVSVLELETVPGVIGGRLAGRVWAKLRPEPSSEIVVRLRCLEQKTRRSSRGAREKDVSVLWEETKRLRAEELVLGPSGGVYVPVEFVIPRECSPTSALGDEDGISWELEVRAKVRGPDYVATFRVPVCVTETSDLPEAQKLQKEERCRKLAAGPPPKLSVRIAPTMTGGTELYWPPYRHIFGGVVLLALAALCGFGTYALPVKSGVWVAYGVLGLFAAVFGFQGLNAVLAWSRLLLEPEGVLRVERKLLGFGRTQQCRAEDIAIVERVVGSTVNRTPYFYLQLRTRSGERLLLGSGMEQEDEIAYLEAMVEDWLAQYKRGDDQSHT